MCQVLGHSAHHSTLLFSAGYLAMIHDDEDLLEHPFVRGLTLEHSREFNLNEYSLEPVVWNRWNARRIRYESLKRQDVLDTLSKIEDFPSSFPEPDQDCDALGKKMVNLAIEDALILLKFNGHRPWRGPPTKQQGIEVFGSFAQRRCLTHRAGDKVLRIYCELSFLVLQVTLKLTPDEVTRVTREVDMRELGEPLPQ